MEIETSFQTPPEVAKYMAEMIELPNKLGCKVFEPTPGLGNLMMAVRERFLYVEIEYPEGDFFLHTKQKYDCIIMNPPFTSKSAFMENAPAEAECRGMKVGYYILKQCMEMSDNVIALMPWYTIADSDVRLRYLKAYGIKSITALPRKTFEYVRVQVVVIELVKGWKEETVFKTFEF